ncbi:alpha/beta hydrolase [Nocardioides sp. Root122]|uniref:alpha/beta fold hydrolase n=1 Tax=Nocardioides TaxID=1839 RepID=UPI0007039003|nr:MULTISPECIES: alpha/beta hydrolase [Nocardioides]KQV77653.1 alpha/beta hydrolase [Nocardioides sp. Root122]MCK9822107.1 alpha/beta hydrolase [Nocardioides cavernae]
MSKRYRTTDVPVSGGTLRVGVWEADVPDPATAPTVVLVHGITASHRSWQVLAGLLPGVRLVAPDLRGRGRSHPETVPGSPTGMSAHADDLAAVLDHLDVDRTLVVGHSMGAFVAVVLADRHPERVSRLLLVDGGLPLAVPNDLSADEVISLVLGPVAERLAMRFASVEEYYDFWRRHPAFARDWTPALEDYLAYDLVGEEPELRPATSYDAMAADTVDMNTGTALRDALGRMHHSALLLTAPRGLFDETPGLYETSRLAGMLEALPTLNAREVPDVNHYTITMAEAGAKVVAEAVLAELSADR